MKFAVSLPNYKKYADIHTLIRLAKEAEAAGWDGLILWDHEAAGGKSPVTDPWVAMGAIASHTSKMNLGVFATQLFRRNPWKLAREAAALDQLSKGRFILGIGLGFDLEREFKPLGDDQKERSRKEVLDEMMEIVSNLWSDEDFKFSDFHFRAKHAKSEEEKQKMINIPVWTAGLWPDRLRFKWITKWNGVLPIAKGYEYNRMMPPEGIVDAIEYINKCRDCNSDKTFDIIHAGITTGQDAEKDAEIIKPYLDAGVTWWLEFISPGRGSVEKIEERIKAGPPKIE